MKPLGNVLNLLKLKKAKPLKIGLALGSGAARGLSHIGVIKILEQNNIPIDYIAGSSIGAMVGGVYAATKDIKIVEEIALSMDIKKISSLLDLSIKHGIFSGDKMKEFFDQHVGQMTFDKLKIPFTAVAVEFKTGDIVPISKGSVASAIRASMSLPIAFKPVINDYKDKILVDGGLAMPVPVEIARQMGADIIIAVNLDGDYFNKKQNLHYHTIALHSMDIVRHYLAKANVETADVVIEPKVGDVIWFNFTNAHKVILAGEAETIKKIDEIKKKAKLD